MAKVVSIRERVHQPFYDTLVRTAGLTPGGLTDTTSLFTSDEARRRFGGGRPNQQNSHQGSSNHRIPRTQTALTLTPSSTVRGLSQQLFLLETSKVHACQNRTWAATEYSSR